MDLLDKFFEHQYEISILAHYHSFSLDPIILVSVENPQYTPQVYPLGSRDVLLHVLMLLVLDKIKNLPPHVFCNNP